MNTPRGRGPAQYDARTLMLIRASFFLGVAMFGAVTYFLHRQGGLPPDGPPADVLVYLPIAAIAIALLSIVPLRPIIVRTTDPARRASLLLIGWAFGEAAGLAGAIYYFFTDQPRFLVIGLFVLLMTFIVYPIRSGE